AKTLPEIRLPPCRGTRFIAGPAFSASPRPPAVENTTSCALPTSATVYETPVPFSDAPSDRPSTVNRPSLPGPPRIANVTVSGPARPPTSWLPERDMPGTSVTRLWYSRAVGMAATTSLSSTLCCFAFTTSTIGDSPLTVIVSSSAPTRSSALTCAASEPVSSIPSRLTVLNPASVKVTTYDP